MGKKGFKRIWSNDKTILKPGHGKGCTGETIRKPNRITSEKTNRKRERKKTGQ